MTWASRIKRKSRGLTAIIFLGAVSVSHEAGAEIVDASVAAQQIELFDVILRYPQPPWVVGSLERSELLNRSKFYRDFSGNTFVLEQIPSGQEFDTWDSLFAVTAEELAVGRRFSMQDFIGLAERQNRLVCVDRGYAIQVLRATQNDSIVFMVCGSTEKGSTTIGYGPGVGEASLWRFLIYDDTYLKIYQRWRSSDFTIENRDDWPMTEVELREMVRRITDGVEVFRKVSGQ